MDTQLIKNDKNAKNNGKYDNLKKGAAVAAATVAGAGVAYGANEILNGEEAELDVPIVNIDPHNIPDPEPEPVTPVEPPVTPVEPPVTPGPTPQEDIITEDITGPEVGPEEPISENTTNEEEINEIAQEIIGEDYIDPTDIDAPNLDIASIGTITTADGQELAAAQIISDRTYEEKTEERVE